MMGPLLEVAALFLRLGLSAFGGPAAHVALMQREAVERRGWISRQGFLDLYAACQLLPGPGSTQLAMALGRVRAGWRGLMVAGWQPLAALALGGSLNVLWRQRQNLQAGLAVPAAALSAPAEPLAMAAPGLAALGAVFLKLGGLVFGSGYVLVAFLRSELVDQRHWLSPAQLMDAVAAGQLTPGPLFSTAAFVGYLLRGPAGAAVATIAIFLPSFVMVAALGALQPRLQASPLARAFLGGVGAAAWAALAWVGFSLAGSALAAPWAWAVAAAAFVFLRRGWEPLWLMLLAAAAGWALA
jgi:chromate transporter